MVDPVTVSTAIAAGSAAASAATSLFRGAVSLFKDAKEFEASTLTSFGRITRITSRVFIDASVMSEPILSDILKSIHTQYAGFIISALQLNQLVTNGVTVRDMLRVVSSENAQPHMESLGEILMANQPRNNRPQTTPNKGGKPRWAKTAAEIERDRLSKREDRIEKEEEDRLAKLRGRRNVPLDIVHRRQDRIIQEEEDRRAHERTKEDREKQRLEKEESDRAAKIRARKDVPLDRLHRNQDQIMREEDERVARQRTRGDRRDARLEQEEEDRLARERGLKTLEFSDHDVVSLDGNGHVPSGKIIEITMTNPDNPKHQVKVNLLIQLAPYQVPEPLAVAFLTKDLPPTTWQRFLQWKTGEISFWSDFVGYLDVARRRAQLLKLDPAGVFREHFDSQQTGRQKVVGNVFADKPTEMSRNVASSVIIFSNETIMRAKAESPHFDINDFELREKYFARAFAMMLVVVDTMYNQVTFYYNGIPESGTFTFDQMRMSSKSSSNNLDLLSVMNSLNQGRAPKF